MFWGVFLGDLTGNMIYIAPFAKQVLPGNIEPPGVNNANTIHGEERLDGIAILALPSAKFCTNLRFDKMRTRVRFVSPGRNHQEKHPRELGRFSW